MEFASLGCRGVIMKCHPFLAVIFFISVVSNCTFAEEQHAKTAHAAEIQISEIDYERCGSTMTEFTKTYSQLTPSQRVEGFYSVAQCQEKLGQSYDATMLSYAKAVTAGDGLAGNATVTKAKENLERLYRITHNNTIVGIDKVYKKAKEAIAPVEK
jgi:hypothetical protein